MRKLKKNEIYYFEYDDKNMKFLSRKIILNSNYLSREEKWSILRKYSTIKCWHKGNYKINYIKNDFYLKVNNLIKEDMNYRKKLTLKKIQRIFND